MCRDCATVNSFHKRLSKIEEQEDGLPELINRLDFLISKWVRYSAKGADGLTECFTCRKRYNPSELDAGHYITRDCQYLRFDVARNIRPQCRHDNRGKYGLAAEFGKRLEEENPGSTEILLEESRIIHKWTRDELKQMILDFEQKLKQLK